MSGSSLALIISGVIVLGLVVSLGVLSLFAGVLGYFWKGARFVFLRSEKGVGGFAFGFIWDQAREPARYHLIKLRLFNPYGTPTQLELTRSFPKTDESFALDLEMGEEVKILLGGASGLDKARVQVELESLDGINFIKEFKALDFIRRVKGACETVADFSSKTEGRSYGLFPREKFWVVGRDFIADTVPGKGAPLAIPTNPAFAAFFQGAGGAASQGGAKAEETQENFSVSKVWIEDGCIVCNACEDIYPEVFKVIADGCEVRPGHPSDDGLKVEEAAEACPVEIIKFAKA